MAWIIGVALGAILMIVLLLFVVAMPKFKKMQELVDKLNLVSREMLTGIPVIRAFNTEKKEEDRFVQIMKLFMSKDLGDNVILMNNQELTSSCFYCKVIKEIQVNSNLLEGYLIQLRLTCQKLNIPLVEVK